MSSFSVLSLRRALFCKRLLLLVLSAFSPPGWRSSVLEVRNLARATTVTADATGTATTVADAAAKTSLLDDLAYESPPATESFDDHVFAAYKDLDDLDCASMRIPLREKDWNHIMHFISNNGTHHHRRLKDFDSLPLLVEEHQETKTEVEPSEELHQASSTSSAQQDAKIVDLYAETRKTRTGFSLAQPSTTPKTHAHTTVSPRSFFDLSSDTQLILEYLSRLIPQRHPELGRNIQGPWQGVLKAKMMSKKWPEHLIQCPKIPRLQTLLLENGCPMGALAVAAHKVLCMAQLANLFLSRKHDPRFTSADIYPEAFYFRPSMYESAQLRFPLTCNAKYQVHSLLVSHVGMTNFRTSKSTTVRM